MGFHNRISSIVVAVLFLSTSLVALLPLEDISTEAGDTGSEPLEAFVPLPATDFHDVMWAYDSSWAIAVGDEGNISIYDPGTGVWGQLPGASFGDDLKELELLPNVGYGAVGLQGPGGGNFYVATADTAGFEKVNSPPGNFTDIIIGGEGAIMLGSPGNSSFFFQGATHTRWMPTGSLNVARYGHSATMLPGGNVLLSGGEFGGTTLASSIIYNYTTTRWTTVKTMTMGTKDHAAHRLSTGHILLTGGHDSRVPGPVNNASFYDGSTDTWADTTFMNDARSSHTMTLLQNGTSMVVGGQGNGVVLATAELLVSGVWIPLNALPAERKDHTASLLPDGNVLIVGGMDDSGQALNDCYIYNTSTNT
ncbi:MAG: hypothetical protein KAT70_08655, partial [Thermoplasmata archaeon]|nr:hypothetical protein [Thermoplasmata archaeon]